MQLLLHREVVAVSAGKLNAGIGVAVVFGTRIFTGAAATGNAHVGSNASNGMYSASSMSGPKTK